MNRKGDRLSGLKCFMNRTGVIEPKFQYGAGLVYVEVRVGHGSRFLPFPVGYSGRLVLD